MIIDDEINPNVRKNKRQAIVRYLNYTCSLINLICYYNTKKPLYLLTSLIWLSNGLFNLYISNIKDEEYVKMEKEKFFNENEQIINYELIKRASESINIDYNNLGLIRKEDLDKYDIKELKEIVELIKNAYPEEIDKIDEQYQIFSNQKGLSLKKEK